MAFKILSDGLLDVAAGAVVEVGAEPHPIGLAYDGVGLRCHGWNFRRDGIAGAVKRRLSHVNAYSFYVCSVTATVADPVAPPFVEPSAELVEKIVGAVMILASELVEHPLYDYQEEVGRRFVEAVVTTEAEELTLLAARQSGKTEAISAVIAAMMILLPRIATVFPELLGQFKTGLMVGVFAPVEEQADTMFKRIVGALSTDTAQEVLEDDEIDDILGKDGVKTVTLRKCKSFCRSQTAHRAASIESKTYHVVVIDECQAADEHVITKSIQPMLVSKAGTILKTGSAARTKGNFYTAIQRNKSRQLLRGSKKYHFEYNWRYCARSNPLYLKAIEKEKEKIGEDSEDFLLSYECRWLLDRGMFISEAVFEALSDKTMGIVDKYYGSRLVAGLDVARKRDSTVLTILWADFDHPDPKTGLIDCRVLNWLEIPGDPGGKWHSRYNAIADFLENYQVMTVGVDSQGLGDVVREDLEAMLPHIEWRAMGSDIKDQSERWKHLSNLMGHGFVGWPGRSEAKRTKIWQRFRNEMENLEKIYKSKYLLVAAPDQEGAHDDFADSLALATWLPKEESMPQMAVSDNQFFRPRSSFR